MNAATEADRELLWALLRRRAEELPTVALGAVAATFAELASTTARLLAAGPTHPDEEPLPEADVPRVLAARDAVVGEVRALADILVGVRRVPMPTFGPGTW